MQAMKTLIIEDDHRVSGALAAYLTKAGYSPVRAPDGDSALEALGADTEVVLLDLGLPDIDGVDLCRRIRHQTDVPIIIVTARSRVQERIKGLRAGADDFIVKPYDVRELVARIEAITRRSQSIRPWLSEAWNSDELGVQIDFVGREVTVDEQRVELTRKEFDIVALLARYPGVAVPRERIIREVWNTDWHGFSRSLEVHIASARRKIDKEPFIETVRGVGYRLSGL